MSDPFVWHDLEALIPVRPREVSIEHRLLIRQLADTHTADRVRRAFYGNGYTNLYSVPEHQREAFLLAVKKDLSA